MEEQGKKKIKAVSKALRNLDKTPVLPAPPALIPENESDRIPFTQYDFHRPPPSTVRSSRSLPEIEEIAPEDESDHNERPPNARQETQTSLHQSPPIAIPRQESEHGDVAERSPLHGGEIYPPTRRQMNYGSIIGSPPSDDTPGRFDALHLPAPAISPASRNNTHTQTEPPSPQPLSRLPPAAQVPQGSDAYHVGETVRKPRHSLGGSLARSMFKNRLPPKMTKSQSVSLPSPANPNPRSRLRRLFSAQPNEQPVVDDVRLEAYKELDARQAEFFSFLDKELDKIESFYKMKEDEATARLQVLRQQLHEMRDRRLAEILQEQYKKGPTAQNGHRDAPANSKPSFSGLHPVNGAAADFLKKPLENALGRRSIGKTSQAMKQLSSPPGPKAQKRIGDGKQDYVRRDHGHDVPYRTAKRRLKLALQEFYRGLELLKSYAIVNRTGFRKINKKYDKAVQARPALRYMSEKVNHAYFVNSDIIDHHLIAVEDLYTRYFERGNHKVAVRKLRSRLGPGDQSGTTFRNGLYVAAGICFGVTGLVNAAHLLRSPDPTISTQTSYLLQIYAGYFLSLLLFLLFSLDCRIWTMSHVNYVFIFEYDTRHVLDWRQLAEIPCFFLFLNGLFLYLNFEITYFESFFLYWPVILISITLLIMGLPFKILYYESRRWWGYSNWRLLCAGFYPVEFRDFYLGDMYCSETYAMGQIEAFFCLYVNDWNNPPQCNSSHSRLMGFLSALPAVWRALQCLRRYYDSRNWFPHLANCAKYFCNIVYYMTLSMYRIDMSDRTKAIFITFALINGLYCSFWDVFLDFSLGNPSAKHPFLRDQLAYKKVWVYYAAIFLDVVLRQQWIFYAIFTSDVQHSSTVSFFVALAEVLRRGIWSLFRVENEHCNNVGKFRASRDIPLPYEIPESPEVASKAASPTQQRQTPSTPGEVRPKLHLTTGVDLEHASPGEWSVRNRRAKTPGGGATPLTPGMRALQRVGSAIASAHTQDFEKRRRPDVEGADGQDEHAYSNRHDSDDEDDDDSDDGGVDEVEELRRQQREDVDSDQSDMTEAQRLLHRARSADQGG
ncbi:Xenotropic and polytropic retrovirus receptor 1 [Elasticomyces elasticus]|uniref:Xenotropic and polytropic retrovirus receptor 1 n=1 Tax=Exophiala sideris TaxID=1016849 RepID=A0ABR0JNE4_9EURO|nr:Xenotropic and polytropic retrovirus receptor 1 [Elasticomyces elasticus]KAK5038007.1 Xenotropic and polytropic retrovirus receptor 1 [Exophiala sideris]KAK5043989.1 Xenotropic and polytropic retrovirus receptor 1 [Exophiala sideris]KAK5067488.1 Xenotropic and polytropic retrovirus receptor 1 [Exophiala sideris]KAK5184275.1 Xenotropic and polytropic retrovirus receptor 1 [Eurotiomycetes sp. CCFEE 6388]